MKRLSGTTLQTKLAEARALADAPTASEAIHLSDSLTRSLAPPTVAQPLLRAFVDVCLAIDFAHARNVVHRDLKPANIMLGGYGEVYVLDWGVARVLGAGDATERVEVPASTGGTYAGALLGTPGYMAPEQARGEQVGTPADVYSLGCILFEILAGEPAHPSGAAALAANIANEPGTPDQRTPERGIAPELDALCAGALATDPEARPSVRALADAVQRYLDGDRDLALRRKLADQQITAARAAKLRGDGDSHADAIRAASHAFALDPESRVAANVLTSLIFEPPRTISAGLEQRLRDVDTRAMAQQWRSATAAYAVFFLFLPLLVWQGVRDWTVIAAGFACITAIIVIGRTAISRTAVSAPLALALNMAFMLLFTRLYGTIFVIPGILAVETFAWMAYPRFIDHPWAPLVVMGGTQLVPIVLEQLGVITSTWSVHDGEIVTTSVALDISPGRTQTVLVLVALATVVVAGVFSRALAKGRRDAQRELEIQTWNLRHLLPS